MENQETQKKDIVDSLFTHFTQDFPLRVILTILIGIGIFTYSLQIIRGQQAQGNAKFSIISSATNVIPNDIFTVNVGLESLNQPIYSVDSVLYFNSDILQVTSVEIGATALKTILPGTNNVVDLTKAITINTTDPTKSTIEIGLASFDQILKKTTPPVQGLFSPGNNPIMFIRFKAKKTGTSTISFKYAAGSTTDSNAVTISNGNPVDILALPNSQTIVTVASPTVPSPTPTPLASASPLVSPSPAASSSIPSPGDNLACQLYNVNSDTIIDIRDIMLVAAHWKTQSGDTGFDSRYDFDQNGVIDIFDISKVSTQWGKSCL